jgi:hypothetical protein
MCKTWSFFCCELSRRYRYYGVCGSNEMLGVEIIGAACFKRPPQKVLQLQPSVPLLRRPRT